MRFSVTPLALTQICRQYTMMKRHEHRPASDMMVSRVPAPSSQGHTLVHFSAQLERFVWDRGCA